MKRLKEMKYFSIIAISILFFSCAKELEEKKGDEIPKIEEEKEYNIYLSSNTKQLNKYLKKDYTICWYGEGSNAEKYTDTKEKPTIEKPFEYKLTIKTEIENPKKDNLKITGEITPYKIDTIKGEKHITYNITYRPPLFDEMVEVKTDKGNYYHPYNNDWEKHSGYDEGLPIYDPLMPLDAPLYVKKIYKKYKIKIEIGEAKEEITLYTKINTAPYFNFTASVSFFYGADNPQGLGSRENSLFYLRNKENKHLDDDLIYNDSVVMYREYRDGSIREIDFKDFTHYGGWYKIDDNITAKMIREEEVKEFAKQIMGDFAPHDINRENHWTDQNFVNHFILKDSYGGLTDFYLMNTSASGGTFNYCIMKHKGKLILVEYFGFISIGRGLFENREEAEEFDRTFVILILKSLLGGLEIS